MRHHISGLRFLVFITACLPACREQPAAETVEPVDVQIVQQWDGEYPVAALSLLPEQQRDLPVGCMLGSDSFSRIWEKFKPGETTPPVNFDEQMVVYYRNTTFFNRTSVFRATLQGGVLALLARETMSAIPIADKVAMSMAVVPRAGIKFVRSGEQMIPVKPERNGS